MYKAQATMGVGPFGKERVKGAGARDGAREVAGASGRVLGRWVR
jgi:hypothetical protein